MVVQSPYNLEIPSTDILTYLFGSGTPSDKPVWIDAVDPSKFLSPRTLLQWVKRLAVGLDRLGLRPGEVVLIFTPNHIFVPVAYLGTVGSGRVFSGANPGYGADELAYQIRELSPRVVLVHPGLIQTARSAAKLAGLSQDCLYLFDDEATEPVDGVMDWRFFVGAPQEAEKYQWTRLDPDSSKNTLATVNFSSGTTGLPKGVMITHLNLIANLKQANFMRNTGNDLDDQPQQRWMGLLPLYHAYGQLYACLLATKLCIPVFIMKAFVFEEFLRVIETYRITHLHLVPPILVMLSKRPETSKYDFSSVTNLGCGAAPMSSELQNDCAKRFKLNVSQAWGMTELTCMGLGHPAVVDDHTGSVGVLMPNCEAKLLDESGQEVGPNERGELYFRGPNVSPGYWRNEEATKQSMLPGGWLRTGDVAMHDERGWFWIVDRLKELIKVNGIQVAPAELEAMLLQHDDIADVAVAGITIDGQEWPRAYVVLQDTSKGKVSPKDVQDWVKTRAAKHKWLHGGVVFIDAVPKLASGKIQRKILRAWVQDEAKNIHISPKAQEGLQRVDKGENTVGSMYPQWLHKMNMVDEGPRGRPAKETPSSPTVDVARKIAVKLDRGIFTGFLAYARNLFIPPSHYGIGNSTPVRSLANALNAAGGGRNTVAFVNNGFIGGDIEAVIDSVAATVRSQGKIAQILSKEEELLTVCRSSLRGVSACFGAAVFYGSPSEGPGAMWNYSLRADGGLGSKIDTTNADNDVEVYPIPLQHAIDFSIASHNNTVNKAALPNQVNEYPFTSMTQQQRNDDIRIRYMGGIIDILGVAFFIGIVGVIYQLVGLVASERELGMTQIIDASMPNKRRWEPQVVRLIANHAAFDIMFVPGWIGIALILAYGVFAKTSLGILIIFNLLAGLSLSSFSIFGAAFFHKAQLSGISTTIISLLLAVLSQVINKQLSTGAVAILGLLFPPMNYNFFTILMARWERQNLSTNLVKSAPQNPWTLPGIVFFVFAIIHIIAFPILGALVERKLYGTASKGRTTFVGDSGGLQAAVQLSGFTKLYQPSWWARNIATRFGKRKEVVTAVDDLSLTIPQGQIMVLLGSNGSGKSTTLEAIAGLNTVTSGSIAVDGYGGLGICPQRNVLWDQLTSYEHVRFFNRLKSIGKPASKAEIQDLITACDLDRKIGAKARHLSGGQKRKLQLSMMFTGGSRVCCVDECSSGVDALARQKLWQILLAERGARTIIFTTHFLDEADLLSDQIAILSRGNLKAQGSAVELKHRLGGGYRINVFKVPGIAANLPEFSGITRKVLEDKTVYTVPDSAQAAEFVKELEAAGITNYEINSPSIEEIFFNVAEEADANANGRRKLQDRADPPSKVCSKEVVVTEGKDSDVDESDKDLQLQTGKRIGMMRQALTLFRKRWTVFQRNYLPYLAAFLLPVIAAGLVTLFLKDFSAPGCSPTERISPSQIASLATQINYTIVVGPSSRISPTDLQRIEATLPGGGSGKGGLAALQQSVHVIDGSLNDFNNYISTHYANVTPGGFFLGENGSPPTFAYKGNADISLATITQNALDTLLTNISISTQYQAFDVPWVSGAGKTLQLIVYFGLAMCAYPAFFALYPTLERLRNVRQLHYSNGVRSVCLWSAYVTFDFMIVLASSVLSVAIFRGVSNQWYHLEYLFVVFFCYGLASTLLSYAISLVSRSQLAAFAFAAGSQAVMFLLYFIAYLSVLTYAPVDKVDSYIYIVHFTISLVTPTGSLIRALFVSLNVFSILCRDKSIASYPGEITLYGGPILYLILQSIFLFGLLLWWDSGSIWDKFRRRTYKPEDTEEIDQADDEIAAEVKRVNASPDDGLRVMHLTKAFGSNVAVKDITFGVKRGEVFALLGPNGAGKSTTISLIRGDIRPSHNSGEVFVENIPISKHRAAARNSLGVCPQVDACDQMTVLEHLRFYARVRGVASVEHNVREVIRAVGLQLFQHRMAAKLSGGNKRKLSLAIALMGNPSVLLLDEPSSGMDVCAKRVMWRTLASVVPGRSLVLTTHSMEEADALADRAGIMGKKMLALGTSDYLRRKHGDRYHVHLIMKTAPHTSLEEMERIKVWIAANLKGAVVEQKTYHGQLRFSVPAHSPPSSPPHLHFKTPPSPSSSNDDITPTNTLTTTTTTTSGIGTLFTTLEAQKEALGFEYYSVSQTTLDQVFLAIVEKHNIEEENYHQSVQRKGGGGGWWGLKFFV